MQCSLVKHDSQDRRQPLTNADVGHASPTATSQQRHTIAANIALTAQEPQPIIRKNYFHDRQHRLLDDYTLHDVASLACIAALRYQPYLQEG